MQASRAIGTQTPTWERLGVSVSQPGPAPGCSGVTCRLRRQITEVLNFLVSTAATDFTVAGFISHCRCIQKIWFFLLLSVVGTERI